MTSSSISSALLPGALDAPSRPQKTDPQFRGMAKSGGKFQTHLQGLSEPESTTGEMTHGKPARATTSRSANPALSQPEVMASLLVYPTAPQPQPVPATEQAKLDASTTQIEGPSAGVRQGSNSPASLQPQSGVQAGPVADPRLQPIHSSLSGPDKSTASKAGMESVPSEPSQTEAVLNQPGTSSELVSTTPALATKATLPGLANVVKQLAGSIPPASDSLSTALPPQVATVTSALQTTHGQVQVSQIATPLNALDQLAASAANSTNLAEAVIAIDRQELPTIEVRGPSEGLANTERTPVRNPRTIGGIRLETTATGEQTAQTSGEQLPIQALSPALSNDGMNPAKQGVQMSAKQLLPPDEIEAGLEIPVGRGVSTGRRGVERSLDEPGHHTGPNSFMLSPASVNQGNLVVTGTSNAGAVERVERLVAQSVQSFRLDEPQQLSVVLRPAAGLEVSLHLRRTPDGVEAQLRCDTNQAAVLLGGWDTLKKDLASQGVRLLPLETAPSQSQPSTFSNSNAFSQQQSSGQPRWSGRADAFSPSTAPLASPSLSGRRTPAAAVTQSNALLDRWA